jgi:hypothetical protein
VLVCAGFAIVVCKVSDIVGGRFIRHFLSLFSPALLPIYTIQQPGAL